LFCWILCRQKRKMLEKIMVDGSKALFSSILLPLFINESPCFANTLWFVNFLFVISDWTRLFFLVSVIIALVFLSTRKFFLKKSCAFYLRHSERFFYLNDLRMVTYTGKPNGFGGGSPYWFERMYTFKSKKKVIVFWM
jgi:hypothetical protein